MSSGKRLWKSVEAEAVKLPGVNAFPSQFNHVPTLWVDGREFASFHENAISLGLRPSALKQLNMPPEATSRSPHRDWIWVRLKTKTDIPAALELIRMAADEKRKRAKDGPWPMPDEKALARRRRLHRQPTYDLDF